MLPVWSHRLWKIYPRLGGTDSGIWFAGLMFSGLFLDAEYLFENLKWIPKKYNKLKFPAFVEGEEMSASLAT